MRSAGASGTTIARAAGKENRQARASTKWLAAGFFFIFGLHVDSGLILGHRLLFFALDAIFKAFDGLAEIGTHVAQLLRAENDKAVKGFKDGVKGEEEKPVAK